MGTSFSDRAWGRDSAVYRVTGVLMVIGGWFMTAFMAFFFAAIIATVMYFLGTFGAILILALGGLIIFKNHKIHKVRARDAEETEIINLKKITELGPAVKRTLEHTGILLQEIKKGVDTGLKGMFSFQRTDLRSAKKTAKRIRTWSSIIVANIFKSLRLFHQDDPSYTKKYAETVSTIHGIAESQRDIIRRIHAHVANNHEGLLPVQKQEITEISDQLFSILDKASSCIQDQCEQDLRDIEENIKKIKKLKEKFDHHQVARIQDGTSKTRLSILFYGLIRDCETLSEQTLNLMRIFNEFNNHKH
jgi:hypothetical protein